MDPLLVTVSGRRKIIQENRFRSARETRGFVGEFGARFHEFVAVSDAQMSVIIPLATRGTAVGSAVSKLVTLLKLTRKTADMYMSKGDIAEAMAEQDLSVTYDPYTESILAEVMSSQQTESKLVSAPSFIRPKKKKKLLYR